MVKWADIEQYLPKRRAPRPHIKGHAVDCRCESCAEAFLPEPQPPRPPEKTRGWRTASDAQKKRRREDYERRLAEWNRNAWEAFCGPEADPADRRRYLDGLIRDNLRVVDEEVGRWVLTGYIVGSARRRRVARAARRGSPARAAFGRHSLREEVKSAALLGLYAAARAFRPDKHPGVPFSAHARKWVRGAMVRYLRKEAKLRDRLLGRELLGRKSDVAGEDAL